MLCSAHTCTLVRLYSAFFEAPIPWCEELDENQSLGVDHGIKVLGGETDDVRRVGGDERRKERDARRNQKAEPHLVAVGEERKKGRLRDEPWWTLLI